MNTRQYGGRDHLVIQGAIFTTLTLTLLEVLCAPTFIEAVRSTMFFVELDFWGIGGLNRVMKRYVFKGFNSAVPGHRRTQMLRCGVKYTYVGTSNRIAAGRLDGSLRSRVARHARTHGE
eukprot:gene9274-16425_t